MGALTTLVLVLGFTSLPSSAVAAPALSCGSTVRASVVLRTDLKTARGRDCRCPGPGSGDCRERASGANTDRYVTGTATIDGVAQPLYDGYVLLSDYDSRSCED